MDLLDRVGQKGRNKNSPDRRGLFQPQRGKAETLLLAWLSASLRSSQSTCIVLFPLIRNILPLRCSGSFRFSASLLHPLSPSRTLAQLVFGLHPASSAGRTKMGFHLDPH